MTGNPKALPQDIIYDIETYPNIFTCILKHSYSGTRWIYEISDWLNQSTALYDMLYFMRSQKMRMVGFNNIGFDYNVLHDFVNIYSAQQYVAASQLAAKAQAIIKAQGDDRFGNTIWEDNRIVPQLDLMKVHHFDNKAKMTSLKALEFNMRSGSVADLPFDPNFPLTEEQRPVLIKYNAHDVNETENFYIHSLESIIFRDHLTKKYGQDFTNHNDTKIGKDYFIMQLEAATPGICFDRSTGRKKPRQTPRAAIPLAECIFPYVSFQHPELQRVLAYLKTVTITNTKSAPELKDLHAVVDGFRFDFGTGGIHGSVHKKIIRASDTHEVVDADVTSFYPNLAIKNRVFPAHLGEKFCDIYEDLFNQRQQSVKKSPENLMLKLALNGVYGDSNNVYGPFLDPKYTMTITVNGQLLLCMLAERLIIECGAEMIQANTDGITVRLPRGQRARYDAICKEWEVFTKLNLEFAEYDGMWIRDVNNYLARKVDGKVKRVGAYQHLTPLDDAWKVAPERAWHQDHSAMIVPKAAEAVMLEGKDLRQFIYSHADAFNFMMKAKVPRSSRLMHGDTQVQNIVRYYIANKGAPLVKVMPPLAKDPTKERPIGIDVGWDTALCNEVPEWDWTNLNREYYVKEAEKLLLTHDDK